MVLSTYLCSQSYSTSFWKNNLHYSGQKQNLVLSFPLQNLICCLGILLQINSITPYTTTSTVFCTVHIQIHSFHWLIYKTHFSFYVHVFTSVQCHFLSTNTLQKKFFKLTNSGSDLTEMNLNKKRLQTVTDSSVVDCTACLTILLGGGAMWAGLLVRVFTYHPRGSQDPFLHNFNSSSSTSS